MSGKTTQLIPIQLDDNTIIYVETNQHINMTETQPLQETEELTRESLGKESKGLKEVQHNITQNFKGIESTIKAYINYILNAFKEIASANIDKVTLEFAINIGGKTGIPYVTEGCANSSLKITVGCSFPKETES